MKTLSKLAIGAALALLVTVSIQPVQAACAASFLIDSAGGGEGQSGILSSQGDCFQYGCYGASISPNFRAFFWSLGTGDPAIGLGDDSGAFHSDDWVQPGLESSIPNYFYFSYFGDNVGGTLNWAQSPAIDGCVNLAPAPQCTCLLLSDTWGDQAYYAVISDQADAGTNFDISRPGGAPYVMAPVPRPTVINSVRQEGTNNVAFTVGLGGDNLSAGNYEKESCDCGLSYKIYANVRPRGSQPPNSRDISTGGWVDVAPSSGGTAAGATTTFEVNCGATDTDVYLGTVLTTSDGFTATHVSENGARVECGPTIADPVQRPSRPIDTPQRPRPGAGKGGR